MEGELSQLKRIEHWVSAKQYAQAANMQTRSVYLRFKRGVICGVEMDGVLVIDAQKSPPSVKLPYRAGKSVKFTWPADMPPFEKMARIKNLCEHHSIRGHDIYRDVILGKLKAWYFAEQLFVEDGPAVKPYISKGRKAYKRQLRA